jgi:hypothetical protein
MKHAPELLDACKAVINWEASDGSAEPTPEIAERYMRMMEQVVSVVSKVEGVSQP